jgi:hypothetical protein
MMRVVLASLAGAATVLLAATALVIEAAYAKLM